MNYVEKRSAAQPLLACALLFLVTLTGVIASASVLSVLMLMCLGSPALLLLVDALLGTAIGEVE